MCKEELCSQARLATCQALERKSSRLSESAGIAVLIRGASTVHAVMHNRRIYHQHYSLRITHLVVITSANTHNPDSAIAHRTPT